ncbi:MAG: ATP-grasp domain-containing protein [Candidatus Altiarchaeota archaeon]
MRGRRILVAYALREEDGKPSFSVNSVYSTLRRKYSTKLYFLENLDDFLLTLRKFKPYAVFNLVEDYISRDNYSFDYVPSLLEMLGVPYTGGDTRSQVMTTNKLEYKAILRKHHVSTPESVLCSERLDFDRLRVGFPAIIKPVSGAGSDEISVHSVVDDVADFRRRLAWCRRECPNHLFYLEEFIDGVEVTVGFISDAGKVEVYPPVERVYDDDIVRWRHRVFTKKAKFYPDSKEYKCVSNRRFKAGKRVLDRIEKEVLLTVRFLRLKGYGRVDIMLRDGVPYVIDVNVNPVLDSESAFTYSAACAGIRYARLLDRIIAARNR